MITPAWGEKTKSLKLRVALFINFSLLWVCHSNFDTQWESDDAVTSIKGNLQASLSLQAEQMNKNMLKWWINQVDEYNSKKDA